MRIISTVILLALLGFGAGILVAWMTKRKHTGNQIAEKTISPDMSRQLAQLKTQLDSGLITKEEYRQEQEKILRK